MKRRTAVVSGPLAFKMRRTAAAKAGEHGLEVLTLPLLAVRLAGGFTQAASIDMLQTAVRAALVEGGFAEIESVRQLPGAARAILRTLSSAWRANVRLDQRAAEGPRLADLALVEARVRKVLPAAAMMPPDLRDAALARIDRSASLLGEVTLEGIIEVEPVWRPLVVALGAVTPVRWRAPPGRDDGWFPWAVEPMVAEPPLPASAELCADPRAEVVEALRWARALLSSGEVKAHEIGIAAISPLAWDEHFLVLSRDSALPIHFTHGLPALDTREGQACAALADVLLNGISQARVRRLLRRSPAAAPGLPDDWARGLRRAAGLFTEGHWQHALRSARGERTSGPAAEAVLLPLVALLAQGSAAAPEAGERLLEGAARGLWRAALGAAPAEALALSLGGLRQADAMSALGALTWGPAAHLAAAPRAHIRLLGLNSRAWPRGRTEDPFLPDHILERRVIEPLPRSEQDLDLFSVLSGAATKSLVLSCSRRSSEGALLPPSRLWPSDARTLARTRIPEHAHSEADRLLARPHEAALQPLLASGRLCWANWARPQLTAHDGVLPRDDAVVARTVARAQSTTSLRRLLRDPLGFVWRYALGWRGVETGTVELSVDAATFGELVHELLHVAIDALEPEPGFARANEIEVETAVASAAQTLSQAWPLVRSVPPHFLWQRTVEVAARLAIAALTLDEVQPGTRSWTEAPFGGEGGQLDAPWDSSHPIQFGGLSVRGRIDRLDLRAAGDAARVTDYKTGASPQRLDSLVLGQGAELQRVVYAAAARQLLPLLRQTVSRLFYLREGSKRSVLTADALEVAIDEAESFVRLAVQMLAEGKAPPGPDASVSYNDQRLALPAALDLYLRRKSAAFAGAAGGLSALWSRP